MSSITGRKGWFGHSIAVTVAMLVAGLQFLISPVWAAYELPPGERITNLPHIPRSMPQKEAYENYDPVIGRNFDLKNFWMRADLRVRPEFRNNACFGLGSAVRGECTTIGGARANAPAPSTNGKAANDFYVQQWVRLGIGYDLSPDVNFYMEIIDSAVWGGNGNPNNAGNAGDPLNHSCNQLASTGACRLGVRAAYVLVRNFAGVQGLSMKAGRQYVIFGNHSLFGHFDWANTGYSHDGIMFNYSANKNFESWLGWFRNSETDLAQGSPVGSGGSNIAGGPAGAAGDAAGTADAGRDVDMFIFYNQLKSIPGILFEPYYVLYINQLHETANATLQGMGTPKKSNQVRHMIGQRTELRKGNWDSILETAYQFGVTADGIGADNQRNVKINAWALRFWLGYTLYENKMKPRLAVNLDWASGDGDANCATAATCSSAGGTFENFFPTNHIHMGYADVQAWKNMVAPQVNFQFRPDFGPFSAGRDHFEIWYMSMNLANARDNYYRAGQGPYIFSRNDNTKKHVGDEIDFSWTRMFADGKVAFQATYGHIFTGGYMTHNMPGTPTNQEWGFVQLWMNF